MVVATERFVAKHPDHRGTLAFLITSDEEADAVDGTVRVVEALRQRDIDLDFCVVGEPSSSERLGDVVRIGRRGSLSGSAIVKGVQGHVAYPDLADNPIHRAAAALHELANTRWDEGDADFPPTSFQVSNVNAGTGAGNVIPGELTCEFNFRFSPRQQPEALRAAVANTFAKAGADCAIDWRLSGNPFITRGGRTDRRRAQRHRRDMRRRNADFDLGRHIRPDASSPQPVPKSWNSAPSTRPSTK